MRKVNSRTIVNRKALDAIHGGLADGMAAVGAAVIERTRPPDEPPIGQGLVQTGDWGVWSGTHKVAGTATRPRSARLRKGTGLTLIAGYGFPGRFNEFGTIHQPARPFFTPQLLAIAPGVEDFLKTPVRRALAGVK